jgi:translation initiation factor 4B
VREPLDLPTQPPYTCHVGNLSFEATEADISDLFAGCGVTNVRVVEDKLTKAPKGFGYVEFETVEGLQKALDLSGSSLQGRSIRTSVAEPRKFSRKDHDKRSN